MNGAFRHSHGLVGIGIRMLLCGQADAAKVPQGGAPSLNFLLA